MADWNPEREMWFLITKKGVEPKCSGKEEQYIDYDISPTFREGVEMCIGCPLLELCDESARARRPVWGVWGGKVYGSSRIA